MKPKLEDYEILDIPDKGNVYNDKEDNQLDKMAKDLESYGEPASVRRIFEN